MARLAPRASVLCIASIAAMAPWPLLGLALLHTQLDRTTEAFMFLGGVTMFPLIILMVFGSPPEEALMAIVTVVWLVAAVLPDLLLHKRLASWAAIGGLLGAQSLFSLAQAVMAGLLVIGKSV
jgi:hypothetical protein